MKQEEFRKVQGITPFPGANQTEVGVTTRGALGEKTCNEQLVTRLLIDRQKQKQLNTEHYLKENYGCLKN